MIETTIAQPAPPSTRESRGLQLYRDHAEEIRFKGGVWFVPSQNDRTSVYEVRLGTRRESCECVAFRAVRRGREPAAPCKHIIAATIARSKTRECAGCSGWFRGRDLTPVGDDHLAFFEGDELCRGCARNHGVL